MKKVTQDRVQRIVAVLVCCSILGLAPVAQVSGGVIPLLKSEWFLITFDPQYLGAGFNLTFYDALGNSSLSNKVLQHLIFSLP